MKISKKSTRIALQYSIVNRRVYEYMKQQIISEASENIIEYVEKNKENDTPTF